MPVVRIELQADIREAGFFISQAGCPYALAVTADRVVRTGSEEQRELPGDPRDIGGQLHFCHHAEHVIIAVDGEDKSTERVSEVAVHVDGILGEPVFWGAERMDAFCEAAAGHLVYEGAAVMPSAAEGDQAAEQHAGPEQRDGRGAGAQDDGAREALTILCDILP